MAKKYHYFATFEGGSDFILYRFTGPSTTWDADFDCEFLDHWRDTPIIAWISTGFKGPPSRFGAHSKLYRNPMDLICWIREGMPHTLDHLIFTKILEALM